MNNIKLWLIFLFTIVLLSGVWLLAFWGGGCGSSIKQVSSEAPTIVAVYPSNNASGIALDTYISVRFDKDIDPSTINNSTFILSSAAGAVTGSLTYDASTKTLIFIPSNKLSFATTYTATVSASVKDYNYGAQMTAPFTWSFTTALALPTTTISSGTTSTSITTTTAVTTTTISSGWVTVGDPGFSSSSGAMTSLAVSNGVPYIAFNDSVMRFNGTNWERVGSALTSIESSIKISFAGNVPYAAFLELFPSTEVNTKTGMLTTVEVRKVSVEKLNGTDWDYVGSPGFSNKAWTVSLCVTDEIYVVYSDANYNNKASAMKYDGASWQLVGAPGFSTSLANSFALSVYSGTPYVVYTDDNAFSRPTVMKFNGITWVTVGGQGFASGIIAEYNLAIASDGTPYVAVSDPLQPTLYRYKNNIWEKVGGTAFWATGANYSALFLYNDIPYIAFQDETNGYKLTVRRFNGTAWETVGGPAFSADMVSGISLFVYNGTPYVAFCDNSQGNKTTVMKYAP